MLHFLGLAGARAEGRRNLRTSLVILLSVLAAAPFAGRAAAQQALCLDLIQGDASAPMRWSQGIWTLNNVPVGGCVTFAGGVETGPADPNVADSLICSPVPNGWHWTVTIPGPYTISYDFNSFPPGYRVCGDIFFSTRSQEQLDVRVDVGLDRIEIRGGEPPAILFAGSYHDFDPAGEGFQPINAHRCGRYTPVYQGACCDATTGICILSTQAECMALAGPHTYLGDQTTCESNPCPQPQGVCCFSDGTCSVTSAILCPPPAAWRGDLTTCDPNPCLQPPPRGACCDHATGACVITTQDQCAFDWLGADVPCHTDTCPPPEPVGACCYPPYDLCVVITHAACDSLSGYYFGDLTVCTPNPCPVRGACCLSTGACILVYPWDCAQQGGTYQGDAHPCEPDLCPPPVGACCDHATGDCGITTEADCAFAWLGAGVPCTPATCGPPVPAQRASWGQIKRLYR